MIENIRLFHDGNDINLCAKGVHTKDAVLKMAVYAGLIEAGEYFSGEAESGWWKAVPHCEAALNIGSPLRLYAAHFKQPLSVSGANHDSTTEQGAYRAVRKRSAHV